jgi:hypothetical protein
LGPGTQGLTGGQRGESVVSRVSHHMTPPRTPQIHPKYTQIHPKQPETPPNRPIPGPFWAPGTQGLTGGQRGESVISRVSPHMTPPRTPQIHPNTPETARNTPNTPINRGYLGPSVTPGYGGLRGLQTPQTGFTQVDPWIDPRNTPKQPETPLKHP